MIKVDAVNYRFCPGWLAIAGWRAVRFSFVFLPSLFISKRGRNKSLSGGGDTLPTHEHCISSSHFCLCWVYGSDRYRTGSISIGSRVLFGVFVRYRCCIFNANRPLVSFSLFFRVLFFVTPGVSTSSTEMLTYPQNSRKTFLTS